jgi:hypothetical protein
MTTAPRHTLSLARWTLLVLGLLAVPSTLLRPLSWELAYLLPFVTFIAVGWLLTARRPENAEGWFFLSAAAVGGVFDLAGYALHRAILTGQLDTWWAWLGAWLQMWLWPALFVLMTTFPLLLFPSGFLSRTWRWVGYATGVLTAWTCLLGMISPQLGASESDSVSLHNPLSPSFLSGADPISDNWLARNVGLLGLGVSVVLAAVSLVIRARRAQGVERLQIRWVAFTAAVMAVLIVPALMASNTTAVANVLWAVLLSLLPAAMGVAILRYRLYDIDRIISRTTSYAIVTGCLLLTYAGIVTLASRVLHTNSALVVAVATLTAAALARPILRRVRDVVDRRFNRSRYDAQHTVDAFGARLRHVRQPESVRTDLVAAVEQTIQPSSVTLWVRP